MSKPITGELRPGKPTGRLEGEVMEINVEAWTGAEWASVGKEWVPITDEVRAQLERGTKPQVMSVASVTSEIKAEATQDLLTTEQKLLRAIGLGDELPALKAAEEQLEASGLGEALAAVVQSRIGVNPEDTLPTNAGRESITALPPGYYDATEGGAKQYSLREFGSLIESDPRLMEAQQENINQMMAAFYPPGKESKTMIVSSWPNPNEIPHPPLKGELENSGFNVNYYSVEIKHPKREGKAPYTFEVEDLIEAMDLTFHEGNVLKSLIRSVNERNHGQQKKGSDYVRDAEKMVHSSKEELRRRQLRALEGKK